MHSSIDHYKGLFRNSCERRPATSLSPGSLGRAEGPRLERVADDDVPLHRDRDGQVDGGGLSRQAQWVDVGRRVGEGQDDGVEQDAPVGVIAGQLVLGVGQDVVGQARKSADEDGAEDNHDVDGGH